MKGTDADQIPADVFSKQRLQTDYKKSARNKFGFFSLSGRNLLSMPGNRRRGVAVLQSQNPPNLCRRMVVAQHNSNMRLLQATFTCNLRAKSVGEQVGKSA